MILRRNGAYTGTMAGQPLGFKAVSNRIGTIDLSWTTVHGLCRSAGGAAG